MTKDSLKRMEARAWQIYRESGDKAAYRVAKRLTKRLEARG